MRPDLEFFAVFVQQQHGAVLQLEEVTDDGQDAVQHLVQIESGEDRLTGVVQNGDLLHGFEQANRFSVLISGPRLPAEFESPCRRGGARTWYLTLDGFYRRTPAPRKCFWP